MNFELIFWGVVVVMTFIVALKVVMFFGIKILKMAFGGDVTLFGESDDDTE